MIRGLVCWQTKDKSGNRLEESVTVEDEGRGWWLNAGQWREDNFQILHARALLLTV